MRDSLRSRSIDAIGNDQLRRNLKNTLQIVTESRGDATSDTRHWEELRQYAQQVKAHTLAKLGLYLEELETQVVARGGHVHWAHDGADAVEHILKLVHSQEALSVVKSKSMTTEEIHLNEALEKSHVEPIETDLGEYIVQLRGETPSHLIAPALHLSKEDVAQLFNEQLGMELTTDVEQITRKAREVLRERFLAAPVGITGANFGVSETGTLVVVENECNARLTMSAPRVHIAIMGIEKVLPRERDLAVFLKLLIRSATGQKISSYVNFVRGARQEGERGGPQEFHLILLDNGRTQILQDPALRETLSCIRCGACLNACPVYQTIGGHAYGSTYQGPIGAILTPQLLTHTAAPDHPFASSLCGACHEVCPVKIDFPKILLTLRSRSQQEKNSQASTLAAERTAFRLWAWSMASAERYARLSRWLRRMAPRLIRSGRPVIPLPPFSSWAAARDLPAIPPKTFREIYAETNR